MFAKKKQLVLLMLLSGFGCVPLVAMEKDQEEQQLNNEENDKKDEKNDAHLENLTNVKQSHIKQPSYPLIDSNQTTPQVVISNEKWWSVLSWRDTLTYFGFGAFGGMFFKLGTEFFGITKKMKVAENFVGLALTTGIGLGDTIAKTFSEEHKNDTLKQKCLRPIKSAVFTPIGYLVGQMAAQFAIKNVPKFVKKYVVNNN